VRGRSSAMILWSFHPGLCEMAAGWRLEQWSPDRTVTIAEPRPRHSSSIPLGRAMAAGANKIAAPESDLDFREPEVAAKRSIRYPIPRGDTLAQLQLQTCESCIVAASPRVRGLKQSEPLPDRSSAEPRGT
jgi:hypothetical protein